MRYSVRLILFSVAIALILTACGNGEGRKNVGSNDSTELGMLERELAALPMDSINYALGYAQGKQLEEFGISVSEKEMLKGLKDGIAGKATITEEQAGDLLQRYVQLYSRVKSARNAKRSEEWMDSVAAQAGVQRTESGLAYRIVDAGNGNEATDSSYVQIHISMKDMNGAELDGTRASEPITFRLDRGLKCWAEGLKHIREGGKIELYSPASLAYGAYGAGEIGPNSAMLFDIDLLKIYTKAEYEAEAASQQVQ